MVKNRTFSLLLGLILGFSVFFQGLYLEGANYVSYHYVFMILTAILFAAYMFLSGISLKPECLLDWFVIIAIPVYIIASFSAVSLWDSVSCIFRYIACYLIYFLSKELFKNNSVVFFKALYYVSSLAAVYGLYLGINGNAFDSKKGLLLSVFHYHNASAIFFACIMIIGIYLSAKSGLAEKITINAFNVILVSNIVYSQSRGGWLIFGIGILLYIFFSKKSKDFSEIVISVLAPFVGVIISINGFISAFFERDSQFVCTKPLVCCVYLLVSVVVATLVYLILYKTTLKKVFTPKFVAFTIPVVIIVLVAYLFLFAPESIKNRVSEFSLSSSTVGERTMFFKDAFSIFLKNPFSGIGGDCWKYVYPSFQSQYYTVAHPHSYFFELMTDAGILGVGLFLLLIVGFIMSIFKYKDESKLPSKIICFMVLAHSLFDFDTDYFTILSLFFISMAIITAEDKPGMKPSKLFVILPVLLIVWSAMNLVSGYHYNHALKASASSQPLTTVYDYSKKSVDFMPISSNYLTSHGNICIAMALNVDQSYIEEARNCLERSYKLNNKHYETINQLAYLNYYTGQFNQACDTISQLVYNQPFIPTTYSYIYKIYEAVLNFGISNNNTDCIKAACEMMINNYHYAHSVSSENRARIEMGTETHDAFNVAKDKLNELKKYGVD